MSSPTQRTLEYLTDLGWTCGIVEKFNRFAGPHGQRKDLFGVIDIVAMKEGEGVVGIQVTSASGRAKHREKILESKEARLWTKCNARLWLITWYGRKLIGRTGLRNKTKSWTMSAEEFWPETAEQPYAEFFL